MSKKNRKLIGVMTFVVCLSLLNIVLTLSLNNSYAADTSEIDSSGYPTNNFSASSATQKNYVQEALTTSGQTSVYSDNFKVSLAFVANTTTPLYSLMKNADMPGTTETLSVSGDGAPTTISDPGLLYILGHGYNTTNSNYNIFSTNTYGAVTDNQIKQYVTQVAIWLYVYENMNKFNTYCQHQEQCVFTNNSGTVVTASDIKSFINTIGNTNGYNYLKYIVDLVNTANSYTGAETSSIASLSTTKPRYQVDSNATLTTDAITPAVTGNEDNFMYFTARVDDPNNYGAYLADSNNNRLTNGSVVTSFKVVIPLRENTDGMDLRSVKVTVTGNFIKEEGKAYHVTSSTAQELVAGKGPLIKLNADGTAKIDRFSDVLLGYVPKEILSTDFSLYNFTKISKIDVTNSQELPGAHLVIKKNNDVVEEWDSTTTPHYIHLNDGTYQLCETIAPSTHQLNTECITFTVDGSTIKTVVMENAPVEDTLALSNSLFKYIGLLLVVVGVGGLGIIYLKKAQSKA